MKHSQLVLLVCVTLSLVSCPVAHAGDSVRLHVDDPAGLEQAWPMTCGVSFPKGKLKREANVRLLGSGGREVPCQVDKTATWPDGGVKWVLLSFRGRTDDEYRVEYGTGVKRSPVTQAVRLEERAGGITIDTGPARFVVPRDAGLVDDMSLAGHAYIKGGGRGAYVVDNHGRLARLGGPQAEMQSRVLWAGPLHACVRRAGWYVVEDDAGDPALPRRVARGIVWLHFHAGTPCVKLVHRLVLTEDTNKVWFRDIGIEFPTAFSGQQTATFDTSKAFDEKAARVELTGDAVAWMMQDDYPHFISKTSHFSLVRKRGETKTEVTSGAACGEWCDVSGRDAGLTVVLRDFAEQFPKELTASRAGVTAHLWAGRCGRELDFRAPTLVKEYWGEWSKYARGGSDGAAKLPSNAQCSAKTHELWLMPHTGELNVPATARRAHAACKRVLMYPDPVWTCSTGAMGLPILHKDPEHFPKQERLISDFFDRVVLPYRVFPMTGYIAWGCNPYLEIWKSRATGKWYANWYRLRHLVDYNLRRNVCTLYARSGERKYVEYLERFNRFAGDMEMHHWDAGSAEKRRLKVKGGFACGYGGGVNIHNPLYWANSSDVLTQGSSGTDLVNYMYQFYFTGDWHARELAENYGYAMKRLYDFDKVCDAASPFLILRHICTLYSMDWDEEFGKMMRDVAHRLIDLNSPNGLYEKMEYGPLYKVTRNVSVILDYWLITDDEHAKRGFLKAVDYRYRFPRASAPIAYQNGVGMYYAMAYRLTKRPVYLQMAHQSLVSALMQEPTTLAQDLAPGLDKLTRLPFRACCDQLHPLFSTPVVLKLLSEVKEPIPPFPLVQKAFDWGRAWAVFEKPKDEAVTAAMYYMTLYPPPADPIVLGPDGRPEKRARIQKEQRIPYYENPDSAHFHVRVELPAELPAGRYRIGVSNPDATMFTLMEASVNRMVLECPDGVWLGGGGLAVGVPVYFRVPAGQNEVRLFLGREVNVARPDGSLAKDVNGEQIGEVTLPVEGKAGFWRLEWPEPALVMFRNVPPVVAFGTTERCFEPTALLETETAKPELPPVDATFVPGVIGQALQLNGKDVLRFRRGESLGLGDVGEHVAFESFPGSKGTIEFYFRPNWNTVDFPVLNRKLHHLHLVHAGSLQLYHRCGQGPVTTRPYAYVDLLCRGPWGRPGGGPHAVQTKPCGNQARMYFRAGEWTHIAGTWVIDITEKKRVDKGKFHVFINGQKRRRCWGYPQQLWSYLPFRIGDIDEWIRIGSTANGTFDELRISDTVRYEGDFAPPPKPFVPDEHTKALFHFDGAPDGVGTGGKKLKIEYHDAK